MKRLYLTLFALAATLLFIGCGGSAENKPAANNTNAANANTAKPAAAAPTKDALMALEKAGWEAWKNHDGKYGTETYSDKFVSLGPSGRSDKAATIKSTTEGKYQVKSFSFSEEQMTMVGPDVAVLTFRASQDYTMENGKPGPNDVRSAAVYIRDGEKWKAAFYAETPVVDPKAKRAAPTSKKDEPKKEDVKPDAATESLLAVETKIWEAWKAKDGKPLQEIMTKDFIYQSGTGRNDRAETIKAWSTENKCEVKSFNLSDSASVSLAKDVSLLTYKGAADGTCEGQPVTTDWYVSVYTKEGDAWRAALGMGVSP